MRDYPAFPHVFRVTSALGVVNNGKVAAESVVGGRVAVSSVQEASANTTTSNTSSSLSVVGQSISNCREQQHLGGQQKNSQQTMITTNGPQQQVTSIDFSSSNRCNSTHLNQSSAAFGTQQQPQHTQNNINYHNRHQSSNGVINTISGSIPATGFDHGSHRHHSLSMDPPNASNSCAELDAFPGVDGATLERLRESRATHHQQKAMKFNEQQQRLMKSSGASSGSYLWILTPVAASISVAIVIAALAGPQWLYTEEKLPNVNYNGTANFNALDDGAFITKYTKSSLWILCTTMQGVETYSCVKIDYFPKEGYQPDPLDSTPAIPYTVTKSCPYFLASGLFLLLSFVVFLVPTCSHQNNLFYFSAGIMFIVSGLLMLIGLIAYISILKAEIGSKLRPRSTLQPALFKVTYGQSFFLFVFGFMSTEFVGLLNIFLYISLQEVGYGYYSRLPCLTITNVQQKIKEGENRRGHAYASFKQPQITPHSSSVRRHHLQQELDEKLSAFTCKKHPRSNILLSTEVDRRYFFEKPPKCDLHSKNLARSLNELYTEPAPPLAPPPPFQSNSNTSPGSASALPLASHTLPLRTTQFADLPHEFPLTRSVSTATELNSNGGSNAINGSGDATSKDGLNCIGSNRSSAPTTTAASRVEQRNRRNQSTNTQPTNTSSHETKVRSLASAALENGVVQAANDITNDDADDANNSNDDVDNIRADIYDDEPRFCGLKRGTRRSKDELFTEFCRKAGVRPKPKNIYYIAKDDDGAEHAESGNRTSFLADREEGDEDDGNADGGAEVAPENIYFVDDAHLQQQLHHQHVRNQRKLNSHLSLHSLYTPEKSYQRSLIDLDSSNADLWQQQWQQPPSSYGRPLATHGGSHNRLQQLNYNHDQLHQSRTLPRSFLKRSSDSQDSLDHVFRRGSVHALNGSAYNNSTQQNRLAAFMFQQQQLQQQQRYLPHSREDRNSYHSGLALHKSCDDIFNNFHQPPATYVVHSRPQHLAVPSNNVASQQPPVQWPTAIPTSPSNFAAKSYIYAPDAAQQLQLHPHLLVSRSASSGSAAPPHKLHRSYAFDGQRRASAAHHVEEAFDLDEMERERRRSHASLFGGGGVERQHYDMINGTAV